MFIWKTNFTFIFFVVCFIIILGLHFFHTCLTCSILECCYSAVAVIQVLWLPRDKCRSHKQSSSWATFSEQVNESLRFWGTGILIFAAIISGNLNAILLVFSIQKYVLNHNFLIVCMQRSHKIRICFDSMNHEVTLKNESVCFASLKNRLLVFMSGMCYQVHKGESMPHSAHFVCTEKEESLSTFSPHTEPLLHSTIKHLKRDKKAVLHCDLLIQALSEDERAHCHKRWPPHDSPLLFHLLKDALIQYMTVGWRKGDIGHQQLWEYRVISRVYLFVSALNTVTVRIKTADAMKKNAKINSESILFFCSLCGTYQYNSCGGEL